MISVLLGASRLTFYTEVRLTDEDAFPIVSPSGKAGRAQGIVAEWSGGTQRWTVEAFASDYSGPGPVDVYVDFDLLPESIRNLLVAERQRLMPGAAPTRKQ